MTDGPYARSAGTWRGDIGAVLRGLVLIVVVLLLVVGGMVLLAPQKPRVSSGLADITPNPSAATQLDDKITALQKQIDAAKRAGKTIPVSITFTEQELTSKAAQYAASDPTNPLHPSNVQVHLANGQVIVTSTVTVQGFGIDIGISAVPSVVDGKLQLGVQRIDTGGFPVPDIVTRQIVQQIGSGIDPASLGLPLSVTSVSVGQGTITLVGTSA